MSGVLTSSRHGSAQSSLLPLETEETAVAPAGRRASVTKRTREGEVWRAWHGIIVDNRNITLEAVLSEYWGYTSFRPLQREAMDAILAGRDSLVVLPTGGGKSLCFQAPALVRQGAGLALVVSPLISLMKDQVDTLVESGIDAACYNSALGADQKASVAAGIREGRYALL